MSKKATVYFIGVCLILAVLILSGPMLMRLEKSCSELYALTPFYLAQLGLFMFVGIILGFYDQFVYEIKKSGTWSIDFYKILILGIPIGLFACSYIIYFDINMPGRLNDLFVYIANFESGQVIAAQIILGYVLITSFYKKDN